MLGKFIGGVPPRSWQVIAMVQVLAVLEDTLILHMDIEMTVEVLATFILDLIGEMVPNQ